MILNEAQIAQVCHEANRALQQIHLAGGDKSVPVAMPWWQLPEPDRARIIAGVRSALRGATPEQLHAEWYDALLAEGWVWGPRKDPVRRQHPNLRAYEMLPAEQKVKDSVFAAIVAALAPLIATGDEPQSELPAESRGEQLGRGHVQVVAADAAPLVAPAEPVRGPYIGAQVHYVSHGTPPNKIGMQAFPSACRAAIVTEVPGQGAPVGLFVMNPTGMFLHPAHYHGGTARTSDPATDTGPLAHALCSGKEHAGGTWHWPAP